MMLLCNTYAKGKGCSAPVMHPRSSVPAEKGRIENHDQTEAVVRKFLTEELRVFPTQADAIKFSNAH